MTYSGKTSLVAYDNLGNAVNLDIYFSQDAAPGPGKPTSTITPMRLRPATSPTLPATADDHAHLRSDNGGLTGAARSRSPSPMAREQWDRPLTIDISKSTQLATGFNISTATVDGSSPSTLDHVAIGKDGTITSVYKNGIQKSIYQIPLATVTSPDELTPLSGNVYEASLVSGDMIIGKANSGPFGSIDSSSLEQSTADIATQLTDMITAQRGYEANSKVVQTSSQLLQSLIAIVGT